MTGAPLAVKLKIDALLLEVAVAELSQLLLDAPDGFLDALFAVSDRVIGAVDVDRDLLRAVRTDEVAISVKPGEVLNRILATARAGEFDVSVFGRMRHDPVSVGSVGTTNEECKPGESQGSSGKHPGNTHGRCSINEASSPSPGSTAGRGAGSSPDPNPDIALRQSACGARSPAFSHEGEA